ncbi:MAG: hypothetical protein M3R65_01800 [Gemmatimonadota bacterium]|nr:hypothetical protein [Gemmatimonadota bacterium]
MTPNPILFAAVLASAGAVLPIGAASQARRGPQPGSKCIIQFQGSENGTTRSNLIKLPSGKYNAYIGGGFIGNCQGQDVTLKSDSAEYYGDQSLMYLISNVHYAAVRARVDADHMTYWMDEEHIRAEGNVYAVMASGTTMRGPVADYYRAVKPIRNDAILVSTGRPVLNLVQRDTLTGKPTDTVNVVADRITSIADSLVYAGGDVRITRPQLLATGDSAFMDQGSGIARLMRSPTVEARRSRPFTLTGGVIDVYSTNRLVSRVVATPNGHATSQDLQLYADSVDLRVHNNELNRAMAWGKGRAHAVAPDRDILADSIDALLPNQRIHQIRAVGKAYATSIPDTVTVRAKDRDWMRGDTLIATFDSTAKGDTTKTPPVRTIIAREHARAFYHVKNEKQKDRPGINYVVGRDIDLTFLNGGIDSVKVREKASGVYIEAVDSASVAKPAPPKRPAAPTTRRGPIR